VIIRPSEVGLGYLKSSAKSRVRTPPPGTAGRRTPSPSTAAIYNGGSRQLVAGLSLIVYVMLSDVNLHYLTRGSGDAENARPKNGSLSPVRGADLTYCCLLTLCTCHL